MLAKVLIFILILVSFFSQAQLVKNVRKEFYSSSKNRLKNAIFLRDHYLDEAPDSIYSLGKFLIQEGINSENKSWLNYGKMVISSYYYEHGKPELSISNLKACSNYYHRKRDYEKLADVENMMGLALMFQNNNSEAITWFQKSLNTAGKLVHNESYMALINWSEALFRLEKYELATKKVDEFITLVQKQNLKKGLRKAYDIKGKIAFALNDLDSGVSFYKKSKDLAYENGDKLGLSFALNNMAIAYFQIGDEINAKQAFETSLKLRKELNNPTVICESYFNLGEYAFYKVDYQLAKLYYDSSYHLAQKFNLLNEQTDAISRLGECLSLLNNYKEAFHLVQEQANIQTQLIKKAKDEAYRISEEFRLFQENERLYQQNERERTLQKRIDNLQKNHVVLLVINVLICLVFILLYLKKKVE